MDDEVEVDVDLVSVATTADENEERSDDQVVSMEIGDANSVTQFVGDNMDLNLVSIYGNSPFHTMGLIRVISPAPPSVDDRAIINTHNKSELIRLIPSTLQKHQIAVEQCDNDADTSIVRAAMAAAIDGSVEASKLLLLDIF